MRSNEAVMVHRLSGNFSHPTTERRRSKAAGTSWGGDMTDPYDQYANEFDGAGGHGVSTDNCRIFETLEFNLPPQVTAIPNAEALGLRFVDWFFNEKLPFRKLEVCAHRFMKRLCARRVRLNFQRQAGLFQCPISPDIVNPLVGQDNVSPLGFPALRARNHVLH
jgi:hypothetical protein